MVGIFFFITVVFISITPAAITILIPANTSPKLLVLQLSLFLYVGNSHLSYFFYIFSCYYNFSPPHYVLLLVNAISYLFASSVSSLGDSLSLDRQATVRSVHN